MSCCKNQIYAFRTIYMYTLILFYLQSYTTMEFPVDLVELLKHTDVEKQTWNLQVNVNVVTVRLTWIRTENTTATTGNVDIQAFQKKHLSPSARKRNALDLSQWKAKRNQAVVSLKAEVNAQRQSLQPDSRRHNRLINKAVMIRAIIHLPVKQYRRRSGSHISKPLKPTNYCNEPQKHRKTVVHIYQN